MPYYPQSDPNYEITTLVGPLSNKTIVRVSVSFLEKMFKELRDGTGRVELTRYLLDGSSISVILMVDDGRRAL